MANPNELISRIENLNRQVSQLQAERQKQLGMLESTTKQFETCVVNYETAYGVKLTAENLATEYKSLMTTCQKAADELEKQINFITSGAYKQAVQPTKVVENVTKTAPIPTGMGFAGFDTQAANVDVQDLPFEPDNVVPTAPTNPTVVPNVPVAPVVATPTPPTPPVAQSVPPMMQGFGTNGMGVPNAFGAQGMPVTKSAVPVVTEEEANKEKPIAPVGWNVSPTGNNGIDVNNLLSGQFGSKFGG